MPATRLNLDELRKLVRENPGGFSAPVTEEELGRWSAGELSEDERTELLERLASHPEGVELWRVADRVSRGGEGIRAGFPGLGDEEAARVPARPPRIRPPARRLHYALAASWLVAVLGLGLWWAAIGEVEKLGKERDRLESHLEEMADGGGPEVELLPGVPVVELDRLRGDDEAVPVLRLGPPVSGSGLPIVVRLPAEGIEAVEIGLFDDRGVSRWTAQKEIPEPRTRESLTLLLRLPVSVLSSPKRHRLVVAAGSEVFEIDLAVAAPGPVRLEPSGHSDLSQ